ncbi:MAG TPA: phosphoglycolate phosphatase [Acetobacteraceae bacterium]|nr:phosphoglycolate phosphatase [Acetobacteraceae bacterium]
MARTLLLDLDGTLVDTAPDICAALNRLMRSRGLAQFTLAETAAMIGDGVAVLVQRALAARGLRPDDVAVAEFGRDYAAHVAEASRPFPGVTEFLQEHADAGWRMAVCTNKPEAAARQLLDDMGLARMLPVVGGGDSFPVRKPDPAHLLATLRLAGGDPSASVMVGDHANDVAAAHGAGVKSIFVTWGYGPLAMGQAADAVAGDMAALRLAIERLVPLP